MTTQRRLINWGYALCDAGIRSWVEEGLPAPRDFPYPSEGV
jgi:NTE family protein